MHAAITSDADDIDGNALRRRREIEIQDEMCDGEEEEKKYKTREFVRVRVCVRSCVRVPKCTYINTHLDLFVVFCLQPVWILPEFRSNIAVTYSYAKLIEI